MPVVLHHSGIMFLKNFRLRCLVCNCWVNDVVIWQNMNDSPRYHALHLLQLNAEAITKIAVEKGKNFTKCYICQHSSSKQSHPKHPDMPAGEQEADLWAYCPNRLRAY